jgi:hypothetical protein
MLKAYCTKCGHPNAYNLTKPKYCINCGAKFNDLTEKHQSVSNVDQNTNKSLEEKGDYSDIDYVPNINKLDFEFVQNKRDSVTIKDVIGTSEGIQSTSNNIKIDNPIKQSNNKTFLESFKEEAGAIKPKNRNFKNNANKKG